MKLAFFSHIGLDVCMPFCVTCSLWWRIVTGVKVRVTVRVRHKVFLQHNISYNNTKSKVLMTQVGNLRYLEKCVSGVLTKHQQVSSVVQGDHFWYTVQKLKLLARSGKDADADVESNKTHQHTVARCKMVQSLIEIVRVSWYGVIWYGYSLMLA